VDKETPGVDDDQENEVKPDEIEDNSTEHASGRMNLCKQPYKDYNHKHYNVFNIKEETQDNRIILLQLNPDNFKITEEKFDETNAEYMFLTKTLGWKDGSKEEKD
jgi:hypothetical protein